jgi:hypothetical protein
VLGLPGKVPNGLQVPTPPGPAGTENQGSISYVAHR